MRYNLLMQHGVTIFGAALILSGFVAASGCSSVDEYKPTGGPDGAAAHDASGDGPTVDKDGGSDAPIAPQCGEEPKEPPAGDAGTVQANDAGGVCPTTATITAADIDAQVKWKAPAAPQNVCTQQNIDALKALFSGSAGAKYADIKIALGASCASCAFSPMTGANWQVFAEDGIGAIDNRTGSCFAQRAGGACGPRYGAVCGHARFRVETCLDSACPQTDCGSPAAVQACRVKAMKGACKSIVDAYAVACTNEADLIKHCDNLYDSIATSCSGGPNHTINTK